MIATFVVAVLVALAVIFAFRKIIKDKNSGKLSCGGDCEGCMAKKMCHKDD